MFVVLLRFAENKASAADLMDGHNEWLARGFTDGVFVLAGSVQPAAGGAIITRAISAEELRRRVDADPFVAEGVVSPEIIELTPGRAHERLGFLLDEVEAG